MQTSKETDCFHLTEYKLFLWKFIVPLETGVNQTRDDVGANYNISVTKYLIVWYFIKYICIWVI